MLFVSPQLHFQLAQCWPTWWWAVPATTFAVLTCLILSAAVSICCFYKPELDPDNRRKNQQQQRFVPSGVVVAAPVPQQQAGLGAPLLASSGTKPFSVSSPPNASSAARPRAQPRRRPAPPKRPPTSFATWCGRGVCCIVALALAAVAAVGSVLVPTALTCFPLAAQVTVSSSHSQPLSNVTITSLAINTVNGVTNTSDTLLFDMTFTLVNASDPTEVLAAPVVVHAGSAMNQVVTLQVPNANTMLKVSSCNFHNYACMVDQLMRLEYAEFEYSDTYKPLTAGAYPGLAANAIVATKTLTTSTAATSVPKAGPATCLFFVPEAESGLVAAGVVAGKSVSFAGFTAPKSEPDLTVALWNVTGAGANVSQACGQPAPADVADWAAAGSGAQATQYYPVLVRSANWMDAYTKVYVRNQTGRFHAPGNSSSDSSTGHDGRRLRVDWDKFADYQSIDVLVNLFHLFGNDECSVVADKASFSWHPRLQYSVIKGQGFLHDGVWVGWSGYLDFELVLSVKCVVDVDGFKVTVPLNLLGGDAIEEMMGGLVFLGERSLPVKPVFDMSLELEFEKWRSDYSAQVTASARGQLGLEGSWSLWDGLDVHLIKDLAFDGSASLSSDTWECTESVSVSLLMGPGLSIAYLTQVNVVFGFGGFITWTPATTTGSPCSCTPSPGPLGVATKVPFTAWYKYGALVSAQVELEITFCCKVPTAKIKHQFILNGDNRNGECKATTSDTCPCACHPTCATQLSACTSSCACGPFQDATADGPQCFQYTGNCNGGCSRDSDCPAGDRCYYLPCNVHGIFGTNCFMGGYCQTPCGDDELAQQAVDPLLLGQRLPIPTRVLSQEVGEELEPEVDD